jgi:hypothetical protein
MVFGQVTRILKVQASFRLLLSLIPFLILWASERIDNASDLGQALDQPSTPLK